MQKREPFGGIGRMNLTCARNDGEQGRRHRDPHSCFEQIHLARKRSVLVLPITRRQVAQPRFSRSGTTRPNPV